MNCNRQLVVFSLYIQDLVSRIFTIISLFFLSSLSSTTILTTTATVRSTTQRAAGGPTSLTSWRRTRKTFTQRCNWRRVAGAVSIPTTLSRYTLTHLTEVEARLRTLGDKDRLGWRGCGGEGVGLRGSKLLLCSQF